MPEQAEKTSERGPGRPAGYPNADWDENAEILDRLEEHQRFRDAGMSIKQIIALQKIDQNTYSRDEQRLKELVLRRITKHELGAFRHSVQQFEWMMDNARRLYENPDADPADKAKALEAMAKAVDRYNVLCRLDQPSADENVKGGDTNLT